MGPRASSTPFAAIADEIRRHGPMRFDRYMELALYGPGGFYERPRIGPGPSDDFVTSPHVHPVFGQMMAEAIRGLHEAMGGPGRFDLIFGTHYSDPAKMARCATARNLGYTAEQQRRYPWAGEGDAPRT